MKLEEILLKLRDRFEIPCDDLEPYIGALIHYDENIVREVCREFWNRGGKHFPDLASFIVRVKTLTPPPPDPIYNKSQCLGCRNEGWVSMYSERGYELLIKCQCPRGKSLNLPPLEQAKKLGYTMNREQYRIFRKSIC